MNAHDLIAPSEAQYDRAVAVVKRTGLASISSLQRHLSISYQFAAQLLERMEARGVVSPPSRNGSRTLLVPRATPAAAEVDRVVYDFVCPGYLAALSGAIHCAALSEHAHRKLVELHAVLATNDFAAVGPKGGSLEERVAFALDRDSGVGE